MQRSSCEPVLPLQGRNAGAALLRTVGTAHPSTPSTHLSTYPFLLPPTSLPLSVLFLSPSIPSFSSRTAPPQSPTHSMRRQGEEYDLTTLPEILPQQPPPPPTHTCTHANIHSHLPLCHTHALHSPSPPPPPAFPSLAPPDLLLVLHSLQQCCQAVMFFLASPTQFSHSFPLPQHTATSHTPWAQLTH